ncbi:MAG: hypothetical protein Q7K40_01325 [bacterium]|nr:hypothetical protein [bacterium]
MNLIEKQVVKVAARLTVVCVVGPMLKNTFKKTKSIIAPNNEHET